MSKIDEQFIKEKINPVVGFIFHTARQLGQDNAPASMDMQYLKQGTEKVCELLRESPTAPPTTETASEGKVNERMAHYERVIKQYLDEPAAPLASIEDRAKAWLKANPWNEEMWVDMALFAQAEISRFIDEVCGWEGNGQPSQDTIVRMQAVKTRGGGE